MNKNKNMKIIANAVGVDASHACDICNSHRSNSYPNIATHSKGITLIALIITIIVMLILVGVSIIVAINGGLFDTTKKAAKETEEAKRKEQELASGRIKIDGIWYDSLEDYAIGKESAIQQPEDLNESNTKFKYKPEEWTNGEVKVEIDASAVSTGFFLKYSTDNINWKDYEAEIPMSTNGEIYAKLVDIDGNEGGAITANVRNIDKTPPTINTELNGGESEETAIPLSIKVTDSVSGISKIEWYYKLETSTDYTYKTDTYVTMNGKEAGEKEAVTKETTLIGLKASSTYDLYAVVYDVAGNSVRSPEIGTISISTQEASIQLEIGDYVNYTPQTYTTSYNVSATYSGYNSDKTIQQELTSKWRILNINDDGTIDLIREDSTEEKIYFRGSLGYNNAVFLLNNTCNTLYGNSQYEATARSVKIEDIQDKMDLSVWDYHDYSIAGVKYGETYTATSSGYASYPYLWKQEKTETNAINGIHTGGTMGRSESGSLTTKTFEIGSGNVTVTQTRWSKSLSNTNFKTVKTRNNQNDAMIYYELFCKSGKAYFIATREADKVIIGNKKMVFCICSISSGKVNSLTTTLFTTYDTTEATNSCSYTLCPIVSLPKEHIDLMTDYESEGAWNLK